MRGLGLAWLLAGFLTAAFPPALVLADAVPRAQLTQEYLLKAAFLFNFAQFVDWPTDAFVDGATPITIAVLGDDPFGATLDETVANELAHNRRLVVRRYRNVDEIEACHILFIGASQMNRLERIPEKLATRSVLTVGEGPDFTAHSGIIAFELKQRRLRLRINLTAANAARLTISSKLLRQADIVGAKGIGR